MLRIGAAVLLMAAVIAAVVPGVGTARELRRVGEDEFRVGDGSRYALSPEEWGLEIVDTIDGTRSAFEYTRITGNENPGSCYLGENPHDGLAVVNCFDPEIGDRPWVVDLTTFEAVTPPGNPPLGGWSNPLHYDWVGAHWVVSDESRDDKTWSFWNWHTGEIVFVAAQQERLPRDPDTAEPAVRSPELAARKGQRFVWERNGRLTLRDPERRVRLGTCPCSATVALSGGRVAWISGRLLQSYRIRNGSRVEWRIPGERSDCESRRLSYTRNRLYVADFCEGGLYVAKWPTD
jgi:hypothetical protein